MHLRSTPVFPPLRAALAAGTLALTALAGLAAPLHADEGDGSGELLLEMPDCAPLNSTVTVCMTGPDDEPGALLVSLGDGPTPTKYGVLCLDLPALVDLRFAFDGNGSYCFDAEIPYDPVLVGLVLYAQFIVCDPDPGVSNQLSIEIVEELTVGDFVTYTQDSELGIRCEEEDQGGPACLLADNFATLFPNGVILGDQDGDDDDGSWAIVLTTADAVAKFLAQTGAIGPLDADYVDPKTTPTGAMAGELLAAKLNLALDASGLLDPLKRRDCFVVGDLILAEGGEELVGLTVLEIIAEADAALAAGSGLLGPQGDSDPAGTLGDLSDALKEINKNFDSGGINLGNLRFR